MIIYFALFIAFSKEFYRHFYPKEYQVLVTKVRNKFTELSIILNPILITVGYNIIYIYSLCQIYANKLISIATIISKSIITFLKTTNLISNDEKKCKCIQILSFYKNGKELEQISYENDKRDGFKYFIEELTSDIDFDLLILSDKVENTNIINKVHYSECPKTTDYTTSNIKFISMELTYENSSYPVELKNENYNHYIVNNVINDEFFKYYLLNVLKVEIKNDKFDYKVFVIDHNVNMFELSPTSHLIIKENDYEMLVNRIIMNTNNSIKVDEITVDEITIDEIKVDEITVDEITVDEIKVDEIKIDDEEQLGCEEYVQLEHPNKHI
jgi:hypothetical protein